MSTAELAVSYAALILADDGVEITVCFYPDPEVCCRKRWTILSRTTCVQNWRTIYELQLRARRNALEHKKFRRFLNRD